MKVDVLLTKPEVIEALERLQDHQDRWENLDRMEKWWTPLMLAHLALTLWGMLCIPYGLFPLLAQAVIVHMVVFPLLMYWRLQPMKRQHPLRSRILRSIERARAQHVAHPLFLRTESMLEEEGLRSVRYWKHWMILFERLEIYLKTHA